MTYGSVEENTSFLIESTDVDEQQIKSSRTWKFFATIAAMVTIIGTTTLLLSQSVKNEAFLKSKGYSSSTNKYYFD